ncbi:MAG: rod shape-determining protein RodA [Clostridia bacterium]|nr:rod shape-determining protein RodA [Clostridia bacterium]
MIKFLKSREFRLILVITLITIIGLIGIYSASGGDVSLLKKQVASIIIGVIIAALVCSMDYETYLRYWYIFYAVCIVMLIGVLFTAPINNARSWFKIGNTGIAFQPSEVTKIVLILMSAKYLAEIKKISMSSKDKFKKICILAGLLVLPIGLIMIQPDFGTAMVIVISFFAMLFVWGLDFKFIGYGLIGILALAPITYLFFLKPRQKERIKVFLDPSRDPTGSGYHVLQSKLAIGSGELTGMGILNGIQTQNKYLYASTNDFIFASIAEEMGFLVAGLLIILLIALTINCFKISLGARDEEGKLIAIGLGMMFGFHIIVNVGMTMGLVPVTGIPLPFVSYGGSSMLTNLIAVGLLINVSLKKRGLNF